MQRIEGKEDPVSDTSSAMCTLQCIPRDVAAAINPVISDLHRHNTMEEAADLIERLGLANATTEGDLGVNSMQRLHLQLAHAIAGALRYEVAQDLKGFPLQG